MGVMECDRRGCESVMCNRHSHTYGYICNDCFNELVSLGVRVDISEFMDSPASGGNERDFAEAYFNEVFPDRDMGWQDE